MKIFNIFQANILIKNGGIVTGCGLGNKYKTYIEFLEDENFNIILNKWIKREI